MTNKKITDLVELTTPTTDDVFPLVDIATNSTKKAQLANLPISTATQTALDAKQATLVSGTNIKTINSTSLLGSGNISIAANPAGTAGQIQFSNGSAFAADSNLFWDNTNKRLGIGTNAPSAPLTVVGTTFVNSGNSNSNGLSIGDSLTAGQLYYFSGGLYFKVLGTDMLNINATGVSIGSSNQASNRFQIKGSGSTSATTSLLVQNSSGTEAFRINDGLVATFANNVTAANFIGNIRSDSYLTADGGFFALRTSSTGNSRLPQSVSIGTSSEPNASAALDIVSTTKGVLFPRMTTTQKNAITAIAGLVVYDSTTNKLQCYNGSTWNDLF